MRKSITTGALVFGLVMAPVGGAVSAPNDASGPEVHTSNSKSVEGHSELARLVSIVLPECEHEDSTNCYWDADKRSNQDGDSFTDVLGYTLYW